MIIKSNTKVEHSAVELVIQVEGPVFQAAIDKVYNKQKKSIMLPGFRKGKAPRKMVEKMYGAEVFYEDAISESYPDAYEAALKEAGIDPVAYPTLEVLEVGADGYTFKATVTVRPEASVHDYKGIPAAREEVVVTDEDVMRDMKPYIDRAARLVSVDRAARMGDVAVIDFEGFRDGVPFDGGKAEGFSLELGSGSFVPGFEEQVVGMKAGDEKDLDITFPEDYTPELAGAAVVFKVKVQEVKERQEPELDDEFAKDVSEFETLDEFKQDLAAKQKARREEQADRAFENAVIDQLLERMDCEVPEAMVEYRTDRMMDDYRSRVESQGISFEDYMRMMGISVDTMRVQTKMTADRTVRTELALEAVAAAEGLEITEDELNEEYASMAKRFEVEESQVRERVDEADVRRSLLTQKALELVKAAAVAPAEEPESDADKKDDGGEE